MTDTTSPADALPRESPCHTASRIIKEQDVNIRG